MSDYALSLWVRIGIEGFVALSAWLLYLGGRISFGQQGFFVIGAYAAGMGTALWGAPLLAGLLVGAGAAAVAGLLFAAVIGRALGLYFAVGSLAWAELIRVALLNFHYRSPIGSDLLGPAGADGFRGIRALFTGGWSLEAFAAGIWLLLGATVAAAWIGLRTRWGEALRMVGEDETAALSLGIRVGRTHAGALGAAGALAGLGGALFVHYATYVEPAHADVMLGVHSLAYGLIGGLGSPFGPVIGAALDIGVLESFRFLAGYRMILFGGLLLLFLIVRPRGVLDEALMSRLARWSRGGRS